MRGMLAAVLLLVGCPGDPPVQGDQCQTCHVGIEPIHPPSAGMEGRCVVCHGGDAEAKTKEDAHIAVPSDWAAIRTDDLPPAPEGFIKDFASDQLAQVEPAYLRFINPGDIRVVDDTCGTCHPAQAASLKNSIMTTNAGHYMPTRFLAGLQERDALYASHPATDPDCDGSPGTVCETETLVPPPIDEFRAAVATNDGEAIERIAYDHYLSKSCNHCHAAGYGFNDSPHLYRSTGCSACHVVYDKSGTYMGEDEAIPQGRTVYPAAHTITTSIPTETCATCHFQGGRIGLNYRGIRESGSFETPPFAEPWNEAAYRHVAGYYLLDEDTRNDVDETPPDVHYAAGLHCVDCHVGTDVHGDGRLVSTSKVQVDISCEDCHGTIDQPRVPDAAGQFVTAGRGRVLPQLRADDDGNVVLRGKVDGEDHVVPQVATLLQDAGRTAMRAAMGRDETTGFSHTDALTCDTCHTSWNLFCLGCHVTTDMSSSMRDHQTGLRSPGLVSGGREHYSLEHILLGVREDGRIQTVNPSQQVQLTVKDEDGNVVFGSEEDGETIGWFRQRPGVDASLGFAPFFQHTTAGVGNVRTCEDCHRRDASPEELARIRGVYGFGTGEFMLERAGGEAVDALKFLSEDGTSLMDWVHPNTGPVPTDRRDRAIGVILSEQP